jgi:Ca2+-binding EF-hand superfamily protein
MGTESLLELYSMYDADTDGYFSVEEYQNLVCTEI